MASSSLPQAYGAIPTSEDESDEEFLASTFSTHEHTAAPQGAGSKTKAFLHFLEGGDLAPRYQTLMKNRKPSTIPQDTLCIHAESIRLLSYLSFWFMVGCAKLFTTLFVDAETIEHSHLKDMFGYNNICVYWDYPPSRELVALIYPIFEFSFLLYVLVDFVHLRLACKSGGVPGAAQWLYRLVATFLPFKILLICWFRMIFVYQVYPNPEAPKPKHEWMDIRGVVGHTMFFFGVQLALMMVAFENILYINLTHVSYPFLGRKWTKRFSWVYIVLFLANTSCQIVFVFSIFWGEKPLLDLVGPDRNPAHVAFFYFIDRSWLILVGVMPLVFAWIGRKTTAYVKVTFELGSSAWDE